MSLLEPWLEDCIASDLLLGIDWLQKKVASKLSTIKLDPEFSGLYEDSGSRLGVTNDIDAGTSSWLQVIKTSPLTLSDGAWCIGASLTLACERDFATRYHRTWTSQASAHSLVSIRRYTITWTAYGPPSDKLRLLVHELDWRLASHAITHKQPRHLSSCLQVRGLLDRLEETRAQEDRQPAQYALQLERETMSPLNDEHPLLDNSFEPSQNLGHSQLAFGTQAAHVARTNVRSPSLVRKGQKGAKEDDLAGDIRSLHQNGAPTKPARSIGAGPKIQQQDLLNLLATAPPISEPRSPISRRRGGLGVGMLEAHHYDELQKKSQSRKNARTRHLSGTEKLNIDDLTDLSKTDDKGNNIPMPPAPGGLKPKDLVSSGADEPLPSITENSNGSPTEAEWINDWAFNSVSAKVPEDQQGLLQRPDSWQKPPPGHRFPDGSIPIHIFTEISAIAEANADLDSADEVMEVDNNLDVPAELDHATSSDIEAPPSGRSWQASPPSARSRLQARCDKDLPPDSSFEAQERTSIQASMRAHSLSPTPARRRPGGPNIDLGSNHLSSSPPISNANNDSDGDLDMEMEIPQALGEDFYTESATSPQANIADPFRSLASRPRPVVQVKETPNTKGQDKLTVARPTSSAQNQASSGSSKDTSSTSIIYGTYNNPSPFGDHTSGGDKENIPAASNEPTHEPKKTPFAATQAEDVSMAEFSPKIKEEHVSPLSSPLQVNPAVAEPTFYDPSMLEVQHGSSPASAQLSREVPGTTIDQNIHGQDGLTTTKRKSAVSPSKSGAPKSKRGKIHIMPFSRLSLEPSTSTTVSQDWRESKPKIKEEPTSGVKPEIIPIGSFKDARPRASHIVQVPSSYAASPISSAAPLPMDLTAPEFHSTPKPDCTLGAQEDEQTSRIELHSKSHRHARTEVQSSGSVKILGQPAGRASTSIPSATHTSAATIFDRFRAAYPDYTGDVNHFTGQCKQMYFLEQQDKMVPKWMFDDYLIRNRTDYKEYALRCMDEGEDASPYHRFYKDHIGETMYKKGILKDAETLRKALEELGKPLQQSGSRRSLPWVSDTQEPDKDPSRERPPKQSLVPKSKVSNRLASRTNTSPAQDQAHRSHTGGQVTSRTGDGPSTGNEFRDFVLAQRRTTSWTGSTKIDARKRWPDNLEVRPALPRPRNPDVLMWKDEL